MVPTSALPLVLSNTLAWLALAPPAAIREAPASCSGGGCGACGGAQSCVCVCVCTELARSWCLLCTLLNCAAYNEHDSPFKPLCCHATSSFFSHVAISHSCVQGTRVCVSGVCRIIVCWLVLAHLKLVLWAVGACQDGALGDVYRVTANVGPKHTAHRVAGAQVPHLSITQA